MKQLFELFKPTNGVPVNTVSFIDSNNRDSIIYLRPSKTYKGTIKGYIDKLKVDDKFIFTNETIFVSTNGQGSHTYAYVSTFDFVPNSDVVVLEPLEKMSIEHKLFYAYCITKNRYKYSYGRKPKGSRLFNLLLPSKEEIPEWLNKFAGLRHEIEMQINDSFSENDTRLIKTTSDISKHLIKISDLFDHKNGIASSIVKRYKTNKNDDFIPYIRPSKTQSTSIDAYVNINEIKDSYIFPKGTLYVSSDGQGSHTYAYVSTTSFVPNSNVIVLLPKRDMTIKEKIFYAYCITKNRYKFSYGRKPKGDRFFNINIPEHPPKYINNDIF